MPILYLPPSPVGYAGGAGAAEASSRNLPVLAGAYSDAARIQQQNYALGIQAEEVRQRAYSDQARRLQDDRQFQDMGILRANEQGRELTARAQMQTGQSNMQGAEFIAQAQQAQQKAELAAWLNQQDLTQKERMELERQKASVAEVMNMPGLTDDERQELVFQLKTGIDMKTQRLKQEQVRAMTEQREAMAAQNKAQTDLLNERTSLLKGNFQYEVDPEKLAQLQQELMDEGEGPQITGFNPVADMQAVAQFHQKVKMEAQKRGWGAKWLKKADGTMAMAEDDKIRLEAQAKGERTQRGQITPEFAAKVTEHSLTLAQKWAEKQLEATGKMPSADEMTKRFQEMRDAILGAAMTEEDRRGGDKKKVEEAKSQIVGALEAKGAELVARPDIPPMAKGQALKLVGQAKDLVNRNGPYEQIANPKIKARLKAIQDQLNALVLPLRTGQTMEGMIDAARAARGLPAFDRSKPELTTQDILRQIQSGAR